MLSLNELNIECSNRISSLESILKHPTLKTLKANDETIIKEAEAVNKSYPDFYEDLKLLGANVTLPK